MGLSSEEKKTSCRHIDGGYGWVIVCCSFILQGVSAGLSLSVGVFYSEWLAYFGKSQGLTAWVGSINTGMLFACGPFVSLCIQKLNCRYVSFCGGLLSSAGLFAAAYCKELWQLYLTYGLIAGAGLSSMFIPSGVICVEYFVRLRPLAMGLACSGVGLFCLAIPICTELLIQHFGWRVAMISMSAMAVQSCLFSYLLFPSSFWKRTSSTECDAKEEKVERIMSVERCLSIFDSSFLFDIKFILFFINNILWNAASLITLVFIVQYAFANGVKKEKGALLVSLIGLCGFVGRVLSGLFGNLVKIKKLWIFNVATLITVFGIGGLPIFDNFVAFACLCVLYGLGFGGQVGALAVTLIELFGADKLTASFGYIMVSHGIGALIGPPLGGVLYETTQSYVLPFSFAAGISLLAVLAVFLIQIIQRQQLQTTLRVDRRDEQSASAIEK